ncbi:MAG: hypothetical protein JSW40_01315 [Candidatus Omnitrophota bacterium]|nr:MAG: hypothetical protein JSW40_01315 [Candidatus Omnitrophota bacterium]
MPKIIFILLFSLAVLASDYIFAVDYNIGQMVPLAKYTEKERQYLFSYADLVLEVSFFNVKMADKGDIAHAVARDIEAYDDQMDMISELSWVISFRIDKIAKGDYKENKFNILIHSPSTQFDVNINNPKANGGKKYRIYIKQSETCRILIGQELLK